MICDPILCQPLNCTRQVHPEELCCPICEGTWELGWSYGSRVMGTRQQEPSLSLYTLSWSPSPLQRRQRVRRS